MAMSFMRRTLLGAASAAAASGWLASGAAATPERRLEDFLANYGAATDRRYGRSSGSRSGTPPQLGQAATGAIDNVVDKMASLNMLITSARTTSQLVSETGDAGEGETTVTANVTTYFTWGGLLREAPTGSATDLRRITFAHDGTVTGDEIVHPPEQSRDPNNPRPVPLGPASSTDREGAELHPRPQMQPSLDVIAALNYAMLWTAPDNENNMNPDYPIESNNCANFVSQVLHAGGWNYQGGVNPRDTKNWTPNLTGPYGPSRTWVEAASQITFVDDNGYSYLDKPL